MLKNSTRNGLWGAIIAVLSLSACGGGGGGAGSGNQGGTGTPSSHAVGGTVSGLSGTLSLQNGGETISVAADGSFRFLTPVTAGQNYQVSIASQPAGQHCAVTAGSGVMGSADITNVTVACTTTMFTVGGTLSGLTGTVVLRNNDGEDLILTQNGSFSFPSRSASSSPYHVTVVTQPDNQRCNVTSGSGTVGSVDVTNIAVSCETMFTVGGTISGLVGPVTLRNGADQLTIGNDGAFTFATPLTAGASYAVSYVSDSALRQSCLISSGAGTITNANVTSVRIVCKAKAARYDAASYTSFTSQNGTGNLEGTWILLSEGTQSFGYETAGTHSRRDYQFLSRATVRIRRDPLDPMRYFVLTCGVAGAANSWQRPPIEGTFPVPYYLASTSTYTAHSVPVIDATTMRRDSVTRTYGPTGNSDGLMAGYRFSWVLKRISDDPLAAPATVRDNVSNQTVDATCIHEAEGTYVATDHDGTAETARLEGEFYWTDAYPSDPSQLHNSASMYFPRFSLRNEIGFLTSYYRTTNGPDIFMSGSGDQIDAVRNFTGTTSSHAVRASNANGVADDTLEISF